MRFVSLDGTVESFTEAARLTANEPLSAASGNPLYDGRGIGVAIIDSGVNAHDDVFTNQIDQYTFLN